MTARRSSSPAEDLVALIARLPWWLALCVAPVAYVALHQLAASIPAGFNLSSPGTGFRIALRVLAMVGQFAVPALCVAGAGVGLWGRFVQRRLVTRTQSEEGAAAIAGMTWQQFELLVGEGFRRRGFAVVETGGGGADDGVDLELRRGSAVFLVQCKQWRTQRVGVSVARELLGSMAARRAAGGFVVTSGTFTAAAREFAAGKNLHLVDGSELRKLLRDARSPIPGGALQSAPVGVAADVPPGSGYVRSLRCPDDRSRGAPRRAGWH
jgi:restriction system protein